MSEVTLSQVWDDVVTVGLLGTDRRDPPELPAGPAADVVDDRLAPTPAARFLATVAALAVVRRSAFTPAVSVPPPVAPDADDRPMLPPVAARRWRQISTEWPVLEPEWLRVAIGRGWRAPPDVLVAMLRRSRNGRPGRDVRDVLAFGGPLAAWLIEQLPDAAPPARTRRDDPPADMVPAELRTRFDLDPAQFAGFVVTGIRSGEFRHAHRGVLINTVAAMPGRALPALIDALDHALHRSAAPNDHQAATLLAVLLDLASTRLAMLRELYPPPAPSATSTPSATSPTVSPGASE